MKMLCVASFLLPGVLFIPLALSAQCTGTCPSGALTTLPSGTSVTIPAGTTYCISGSVVNNNSFVINGTLIVQGGPDTLGSVTLNRTGVIDVEHGGNLYVSGTFTGDPTTPAPGISNVNICSGGLLDIHGSFQQQEINMSVAGGGVLLVQGSWTTNANDVTIDIGPAALIEICGVVQVTKSPFLTETGTGTSYLFLHTGGTFNGWISNLQNSSQVDWVSVGASAFAQHPAARTCNGCNLPSSLAPPGADNNCGDAAVSYATIILPVQVVNFYESMLGNSLQVAVDLADGPRPQAVYLMTSTDGRHFTQTPDMPTATSPVGAAHYVYDLPLKAAGQYYQWKAMIAGDSILSWVLPPLLTADSGLKVYPNPASTVLYLQIPSNKRLTSAALADNTGRLVRQIPLPGQGGLITLDLPTGLAQGLYVVTLRGNSVPPVALKVFIKGR